MKAWWVFLAVVVGLAVALMLPAAVLADPSQNPKSKIENQAVGGDMLLSVHPYDDFDPAVAYNAPAGEYLAVWRNGSTIVAQRYRSTGQPLGELFPLGDAGGTQAHPSVAYSLIGDRYLVVWEDNRSGYFDIYGQMVDAGGTLIGSNFYIYADDGNQQRPDVDSDGEDFLVVWHGQIVDDSVDVAVGRCRAALGGCKDACAAPRAAIRR